MIRRLIIFLITVTITAQLPTQLFADSERWSVRVLVEPTMEYDSYYNFSEEGLALVCKKNADGEYLYGYIDRTGAEVIPLQYGWALPFCEGLAAVGGADDYTNKVFGKKGYIDTTGKVVIPFEYEIVREFHEGIATVQKEMYDNDCIYIDKNGNKLFSLYFHYGNFSEGLVPIKQSGQWQYADTSGNPVFSIPKGIEHASEFAEGLALVYKPNPQFAAGTSDEPYLYGHVDKTGAVVIPVEYETANDFSEGLSCVRQNDLAGFIDKSGTLVIPYEYPSSEACVYYVFKEGLAAVYKDRQGYGYIDKNNNTVIPHKYSIAYDFSEGLAAVSTGVGKHGYIDKTGEVVLPLEYDSCGTFKGGIAFIKKNGKLGIVEAVKTTAPLPAPAGTGSQATADPTSAAVIVDGKNVAFDAYIIGGNNYFKLRDLAYTLSDTGKHFDVGWDAAKNAITLTQYVPYTVAGGEMTGRSAGAAGATPTSARIYLDGIEVSFTAYTINGNNYFKLRDIGEALDFYMEWNGEKNAIIIDTSKGYK